MKKKKNPEDLMEEDLMETIQHRINELDEQERREHEAREHFSNGGTILERLETGITTLDAGVSDMAVRQSTTDAKLDELIAAVHLMAGRQNTAAGGLGSEVRPENALVEQQRLRREERERTKVQARAAEEQARREREAQENFLERSKWLVGKWNTPDGVLSFIDTDLDSGFYGQNGKTPFLCFTKSS